MYACILLHKGGFTWPGGDGSSVNQISHMRFAVVRSQQSIEQ